MRRHLAVFAPLLLLPATLTCSSDDPTNPGPVLEAVPDPTVLTTCASTPPVAGQARAKRVQCVDELVTGPLAMGRIGDFVLDNARVRVVIRGGTEAATLIGAYAGTIIDAAPHGSADLLKELSPILDLAGLRPTAMEVVDAGGDGDATVRVLFEAVPLGIIQTVVPGAAVAPPVRGAVDYTLRGDTDVVEIRTSFLPLEGTMATGGKPGLIALLGGTPEVVQPGGGVLHPGDFPGAESVARLLAESPDGAFALTLDPESGGVGHIISVNLLAGSRRLTIRAGELATTDARLAIAPTAAEALHALTDEAPNVVLTPAPGDRVEIVDAADKVVLRSRAAADGKVRATLPSGSYRVRAIREGFLANTSAELIVADAPVERTLDPLPHGALNVSATSVGEGAVPVRVSVQRESDGAEVARFAAIGPTTQVLPPGMYRVIVTRGLEYTHHDQVVEIRDGFPTPVAVTLERVMDTDGWASADFHLHTEMSLDSLHPVLDALRLFAAEGLDLIASTDHDFVTRYGDLVALAGVDAWLTTIAGAEVSTVKYGHFGGYPLRVDPSKAGAGAPVWFDKTPSQLFEAIRAAGDEAMGGAIVQINHPRHSDSGFFNAIRFDAATARATRPPMELGFPVETDLNDFDADVIEVWNEFSEGGNERSFEDFLALYASGRPFTMVGNSDTHRVSSPAGAPRTYFRVDDDSMGSVTWSSVAAAIRARQATVAAGIFVTASVVPGAPSGQVRLRVKVQAPSFVDVARLRIYAGTAVAVEQAITTGRESVVRFDADVDVALGGATFVVVRADGDEAARPLFDERPYGVTNPIELAAP